MFNRGPSLNKIVLFINGMHINCSLIYTLNYRPITVLTTFSKVFEKLINTRLMAFINKHHILSESQFGFRENRSTENAISYVVNKLVNALDQNTFSIGVFLDLSKAFDKINHDILLEHYGVR